MAEGKEKKPGESEEESSISRILQGFVVRSRDLLIERKQLSWRHLYPPPNIFLHPSFLPLFHSCARLTFKVQEKVWIVLYFPC